jgi:type II secretory pathway component PulK
MRARATRKGDGRSGMVLMLVLVVVGALALLVYHVQVSAQVWSSQAGRGLERARLRAAARDAAWLALSGLAADAETAADHTNEAWAAPTQLDYPDGVSAWARVEDEERRVNLNNLAVAAPAAGGRSAFQVVSDLLGLAGRSDPAADARALRQRLDAPAGEAAAWHESLVDLRTRLGGESDAWRRAAEWFSALPATPARATPVNVNTAPAEVLRGVLGPGRDAVVDWLLALRRQHPLASLEPLAAALGPGALEDARLFFDTRSRYFSVLARAGRNGASEEVYALAERDDQGAVRILRWVER